MRFGCHRLCLCIAVGAASGHMYLHLWRRLFKCTGSGNLYISSYMKMVVRYSDVSRYFSVLLSYLHLALQHYFDTVDDTCFVKAKLCNYILETPLIYAHPLNFFRKKLSFDSVDRNARCLNKPSSGQHFQSFHR
jgi:hypothetical protein